MALRAYTFSMKADDSVPGGQRVVPHSVARRSARVISDEQLEGIRAEAEERRIPVYGVLELRDMAIAAITLMAMRAADAAQRAHPQAPPSPPPQQYQRQPTPTGAAERPTDAPAVPLRRSTRVRVRRLGGRGPIVVKIREPRRPVRLRLTYALAGGEFERPATPVDEENPPLESPVDWSHVPKRVQRPTFLGSDEASTGSTTVDDLPGSFA